jgi:uncharacterized surface protein with fasciclin (FAS1) repeats
MNRIVKIVLAGFAAAAMTASLGGIGPSFAQMKEKAVTVGGAPMYPSKNIVQNAVNSKDHTTLVAAVKAAGLVPTLESPGPSPFSPQPTRLSPSCRPAPSTLCSSRITRRR